MPKPTLGNIKLSKETIQLLKRIAARDGVFMYEAAHRIVTADFKKAGK
jgi:hypothetical protein